MRRCIRQEAFMRRWALPAAVLLFFLASSSVLARGGGGCFHPESRILKSDGTEAPIRLIRRGDELAAYSPKGRLVHTTVRNVVRHKVDAYMLLRTDGQAIRVTEEHPFYVGNGTYKTPKVLKAGDILFAWNGHSLSEQRIVSLEKIHEPLTVFNLQTDHPNTFFAGSMAVHNKGGGGGCFPAGTMIRTPSGETAIEKLSVDNTVQAVDSKGQVIRATVEEIFVTRARLFSVETDRGVLRTTPDHPLGLPDGTFLPAGKLRSGQQVLVWETGVLKPTTVVGTSTHGQETVVYNLSVSRPHTFLAGDVVVHNKGGSSSRSSSSRSGSSSSGSSDDGESIVGFIFFCCVMGIFVIAFLRQKNATKKGNLDYVYSEKEVAGKSTKTEKLLEFLSRQDPALSPRVLRILAESTFRKLQECWQQRNYEPMKPLLMNALFVQHTAQLQGLVRNHEINRIDDLKVERVDLVNVRYTEKQDQREFTVLITASARDYYVDDRTNKFLRGDRSPARFQEFWTFQRSGNKWLLREIEQTGESDILKDENFVEMMTDETMKSLYEEGADKKGTAGPWLEKEAETKATRIDRLLNFLVQTDRLWNRQHMLAQARQIFLNVFLVQESGASEQVSEIDLYPDVAESLRRQMAQRQMEGITVAYRNLCVRKAALILIKNVTDPVKDEYTVRISAHAQKIVRKGSQIISEQSYVTPFEEYWTFGRLDNMWKLKEVLPPAQGEKMIAEENVDEDSSAGQVQWYYRQSRAT